MQTWRSQTHDAHSAISHTQQSRNPPGQQALSLLVAIGSELRLAAWPLTGAYHIPQESRRLEALDTRRPHFIDSRLLQLRGRFLHRTKHAAVVSHKRIGRGAK